MDDTTGVEPRGGEGSQSGNLSQMDFDIWLKHEDVAMHFNDLLMRWRLQAISGLAALVTLGGFAIGNVENYEQRYWGMLLLSATFFCVWLGLAVLDLSYYRKLLSGAVKEILAVEKRVPVKLSTRIEEVAESGGKWGPWAFYILGAIPIVLVLVYSVHRLNHPPASSSPGASSKGASANAAKSIKHDQD